MVLSRANVERDDMRWLGLRSRLGSHIFFGYGGTDNKMDFVDNAMYLWMYGCMDVWMYGCMDVWMYVCMLSLPILG